MSHDMANVDVRIGNSKSMMVLMNLYQAQREV
jgi:hypothetical protein